MKWKEALKAYYIKNKPDCYLPKKGTAHYNAVLAMVTEDKKPTKSPVRKTQAKKSPAKKAPAKKKCGLNIKQRKVIKNVLGDCL